MNSRRVAAAAAAAVLLVGLVVCSEVVWPWWKARHGDDVLLLLAPAETISSFRIDRPDESLELRAGATGGWTISAAGREEPIDADVRAVNMVVEALRGARVTSDVGDAKDLELAAFGLAPPRTTLSWERPGGRAWSLGLGSPSVGGQAHALSGGRVVLVPDRLLAAADHGLDHFRVKRILDAPEGEITKLEVARREDQIPKGSSPRLLLSRVTIEGEGDEDKSYEWKLEAPLSVPANPIRTASLLSRISSLTALGFGEEIPDDAALKARGLDLPAAILRIELSGGRSILLQVGDPSPSGNAWARIDGGPLVEIRADVARDLLLADDFWRDSRVVKIPKWRIVQVELRKGSGASALHVELAREPDGKWRVVQPSDAPLGAAAANELLDTMGDLLCGRFEDELAESENELRKRWDFDGPGSFDLSVLALLPDGTPQRADCELTPFVRGRTTYFAARTMDEMGRVEVCVTSEKAVDALLDRVREIARAAQPAPASAP